MIQRRTMRMLAWIWNNQETTSSLVSTTPDMSILILSILLTTYFTGGGVFFLGQLESAVNAGQVTVDRLNQMVARILAPWYHLGQDAGYPPVNFDAQKSDGSGPRNLNVNVRSDAHTALAREIAAASSVLLKNTPTVLSDGTRVRGLPLVKGVAKNVAIIGKDALIPNLNCDDLNECNDGTMVIG